MRVYLPGRIESFIHVVLLCLFIPLNTKSQPVNELKKMGHRTGFTIHLKELGNYYYYDYFNVKTYPGQQTATMLNRHKFHKTNYSFQGSAITAGDTSQIDSIIIGAGLAQYAIWNGNIAFVANLSYDTSYHAYWGLTFSVMDTNMNVLIPQKRLKYNPEGGKWTHTRLAGIVPLGDRLAVFYSETDTSHGPTILRTCAIVVDRAGSLVKDTQILVYPYQPFHAMSYPGNRCMLSDGTEHVLLDSNLKVVDTFRQKPHYMPSGPYKGYFSKNGGFEIALPSGTLIKGGEYSIMYGPTGGKTTALSRLTAATRYSSDTTVLFFNGTNEAPADGNYNQALQYNDFDKRIYYANNTRQQSSYNCLDNDNQVQVICTDTLLRPLWRKFISLGPNICATANWVAASDGRGGVGVMGYHYDTRFDMYDTAHSGSFLYHLDSTGAVSVNGGPSPIVRDRIRIYPKPATNAIVIDDILGGLSGYALYDMSGRQVSTSTATGKLAKVSLEALADGPYVLRVTLNDGSVVSQTVLKK